MKQFRAYVSRAQEGILAQNPADERHDSVPSLAEVRERAAGQTLQESLRAEEMREDMRENGTPAGRTRAHDLGKGEGGEDASSCAQGKMGCADGQGEAIPLPAQDFGEGAAPQKRTRLSLRVLVLAILVNVLLGLVLALVMHLDRPAPPRYVYYIELVDSPGEDEEEGGQKSEETAPQKSAPPASGVPDKAAERAQKGDPGQ